METKIYTASRLAEGNRLFPASLQIGDDGITIKFPFLLSGKEITILYKKISAVKIKTPIIGFSDIIIDTTWKDSFILHGYIASEVRIIKSEILKRIL